MDKIAVSNVLDLLTNPNSFIYQQSNYQEFIILLLDNGIITEDVSDRIINFTETEVFKQWWEKINFKQESLKKEEYLKIDEIKVSDMVEAYFPDKGWLKGCVLEKQDNSALVVSGYHCTCTNKIRKIFK